VFGACHQLSGRDVYNNHQDNVTPKQQARAANDETPHYLTRAANFAVGLPNDLRALTAWIIAISDPTPISQKMEKNIPRRSMPST
jgi:hypothetical protein